MGMSRCYSLMKCLLIIFNIIFLCVGSGACGFAAWALWDGRGSESPAGRAGLGALAAWGGALALGALAGLGGAMRGGGGGGALLAGAFALLALAGVAEAAAVWWGAAHRPQLERALRQGLEHAVRREYGRVPSRTQLLDVIQQGLECCGAESPRDWQHSAWARAQGAEGGEGEGEGALDLSVGAAGTYYWVPASCCARAGAACEAARRVVAPSGGGGGGGALHGAACGPRVLAALGRLARAPLALGAALLALHALALPLTLALWLRARPMPSYKA